MPNSLVVHLDGNLFPQLSRKDSTSNALESVTSSLCPMSLAFVLLNEIYQLNCEFILEPHARTSFLGELPAAMINGQALSGVDLLGEFVKVIGVQNREQSSNHVLLQECSALIEVIEYTLWCFDPCFSQHTRPTYCSHSLSGRYYVGQRRSSTVKRIGAYTSGRAGPEHWTTRQMASSMRYLTCTGGQVDRSEPRDFKSVKSIILASCLLTIRGVPRALAPWVDPESTDTSSEDTTKAGQSGVSYTVTSLIDSWLPQFERFLLVGRTTRRETMSSAISRDDTVNSDLTHWPLVKSQTLNDPTVDSPNAAETTVTTRVNLFNSLTDLAKSLRSEFRAKSFSKKDLSVSILALSSLCLCQYYSTKRLVASVA